MPDAEDARAIRMTTQEFMIASNISVNKQAEEDQEDQEDQKSGSGEANTTGEGRRSASH
jgi:hypothetical protein